VNLDKINGWLTLIANLGVIAGLVFVGLELRQNTMAMDREIRTSFADNIHGSIAESEYLVPIVTKIMAAEGSDDFLKELREQYGLNAEEAQRWWRYWMQTWLRNQADWIYEGGTDCAGNVYLLRYKDQRTLFNHLKQRLDPRFVSCVEAGDAEDDA